MEAVIPMNEFMELTEDDLMMVDGGFDVPGMLNGIALVATGAAMVFAPEVAVPAYVAGWVISACGAMLFGFSTTYPPN